MILINVIDCQWCAACSIVHIHNRECRKMKHNRKIVECETCLIDSLHHEVVYYSINIGFFNNWRVAAWCVRSASIRISIRKSIDIVPVERSVFAANSNFEPQTWSQKSALTPRNQNITKAILSYLNCFSQPNKISRHHITVVGLCYLCKPFTPRYARGGVRFLA